MENNELKTNLETYQAQLKQVEAALMIDDDNEELLKLKTDLLEVVQLTTDLLAMNAPTSKKKIEPIPEKEPTKSPAAVKTIVETTASSSSEVSAKPSLEPKLETNASVASNDRLKRPAPTAIETAALNDADDDDDIDFEAMFNLPKRSATSDSLSRLPEPTTSTDDQDSKPKEKNIKLSKEEQEKRREQRKKKLLKKKQRVKEIEEQREKDKSNWQSFMKAPSKGKGKLKGVTKKSIFASPDTSIGKVGVGTCGIGGRGMTDYENPTQYIYKK